MLSKLKRILNFQRLNDSYPFTARLPTAFKTILFISWFIFFFVFLFRSEQFLGNSSTPARLLISFYYGLSTFVVASINIFVFSALVKPEKERNWKVWKEVILYVVHFISISIAIYFLSVWLMGKELSIQGIISSAFTTTLIGLLPVSIHVINEQKKLFKKHYKMARQFSDENAARTRTSHEELFTIEGESYPVSDLLYFESNKNYLNIYLTDERLLTIRLTIKEMENLLALHPQFLRCHRAYIVNTDKIKNVEGNAQGLKLFLTETSSFVPVSRSYISKIEHVIRPDK